MTRLLSMALFAAVCALAPAAHATFISFDERPRTPLPGLDPFDWSADPLGDDYDALGVNIVEGYLQATGSDETYSKSQFLSGGNGFSITFAAGSLPTHVSLSYSSPYLSNRATVVALNADSAEVGRFDTGGLYFAGPDQGWLSDGRYNAHSHASFVSSTGIARLYFDVEGFDRVTAKIDNLYFGNVPAVPEPASLAMLVAGLGVFGAAWRRRKDLPSI